MNLKPAQGKSPGKGSNTSMNADLERISDLEKQVATITRGYEELRRQLREAQAGFVELAKQITTLKFRVRGSKGLRNILPPIGSGPLENDCELCKPPNGTGDGHIYGPNGSTRCSCFEEWSAKIRAYHHPTKVRSGVKKFSGKHYP